MLCVQKKKYRVHSLTGRITNPVMFKAFKGSLVMGCWRTNNATMELLRVKAKAGRPLMGDPN